MLCLTVLEPQCTKEKVTDTDKYDIMEKVISGMISSNTTI